MSVFKRLRGNPTALASLFATLACFVIAFLIAYFNDLLISKEETVLRSYAAQVAAALIGAGIATILGGAIAFLAKPDLRSVPREFLDALERDVLDADFYRDDVIFTIEINEDKKLLIFKYAATIRTKKDNLTMDRPSVGAPEYLKVSGPQEYTIDGNSPGPKGGIAARNFSKECFEMSYDIDDNFTIIKDMHLSFTALNNVVVNTVVPDEKYDVDIYALTNRGIKGRESLSYADSSKGNRVFAYRKSLFPWQGIEWEIRKKNIQ